MEIREVYHYYDRPLAFTFEENEKLFYSHLIDYEDKLDIYWTIQVTKDTINEAESGGMDMLTLLTEPEFDEVVLIKGDNSKIHLPLSEALERYPVDKYFPARGRKLIY